jgi:hypothetical protein
MAARLKMAAFLGKVCCVFQHCESGFGSDPDTITFANPFRNPDPGSSSRGNEKMHREEKMYILYFFSSFLYVKGKK